MAPPLLAVSHTPPGTSGTPAAAQLFPRGRSYPGRVGLLLAVLAGRYSQQPTVDCLGLFHLSYITVRSDLTSRPRDHAQTKKWMD